MATRVGIELSPAACRVIEVDGGRPWGRRTPETRIQSFAVLPPAGPETVEKFKTLRRQSAAVVVWGVPSDHRQVVVADRSYESMRREALAALASAGIETRGVLADIAPATDAKGRAPRRPVVVALAAAAPIAAALAPLREAGIRVRIVMTPAAALTSLARTRREFAVPGAIEAYVALEETAMCIALVRDGALITARELSWGYVADFGLGPRSLDDITARLGDELSEFFGAIGASPSAVSQVCVCGGLPELRSMTARLTERLDIEVEPLDSLHGIDPEPLLEHADDFRDRSAELRLAWAVASEWPSPINLLRARRRQATKTALSRAAIVAGTAAGLGVGWQVQRTAWWRSTLPKAMARATSAVKPAASPVKPPVLPGRVATPAAPVAKAPAASTTTTPPPPSTTIAKAPAPVLPTPSATVTKAPAPVVPPPAAAVTKAPAPVGTTPASTVARAPAPSVPPPAPARAPAAPVTRPSAPVTPPPSAAATRPNPVAPPPPRSTSPATAAVPPLTLPPPPPPSANAAVPRREPERPAQTRVETTPVPPRTAPSVTATPAAAPPPTARTEPPPMTQAAAPARQEAAQPEPPPRRPAPARATPPEIALPFEASLGTILYSTDRKLAIIDGRIVGVGDEVRGARVIDITPTAVFLRDAQGKLRRLALAAGR